MGLGKTLTMISLLLKAKEERKTEVLVEEDEDSEENDENESSWLSKRRKCKYYCHIDITSVLFYFCTMEFIFIMILHLLLLNASIFNIIIISQLNSLLFMCRVNSYKANYRHGTVQIYIST
jgi:hypothetical protein